MTTINATSTATIAAAVSANVNAELAGVLGTQLGAAISNVVTQAVGTAVNNAATQLNQQNGMPQFLVNDIGNITSTAVQGLTQNASPAATSAVTTAAGGSLESFIQNLTKTIVDAVRNQLQNGDGASEVKASGGSWMQAIALAMGKAMGEKASKMVELASKIQKLSAGATGANGAEPSDADKMKAASETQVLNAQFQATGQEFNLLQTTFSTAIKTIGEGMSSVARKQ